MATTYTTNVQLQKPATNDRNWDVPLRANADAIDAFQAIGGLAVALTEVPSTTLNVKVSAGTFKQLSGTLATYAGTASQAMTASQTNYLYLTDAGTLTVNTTGFPGTAHVRLATVVAGTTTITSITDARVPYTSGGVALAYLPLAGGTLTGSLTVSTGGITVTAGGLTVTAGGLTVSAGTTSLQAATINGLTTHADGQNVAVGTTTGTKIGTATTQKLGFFNATPVVQPTGGAATAGGTYTSAEQTMLNAVYSALRNLGLIS